MRDPTNDFAAVIVLCFITFRSWRAVVVAVVPLARSSSKCGARLSMPDRHLS